MTTSPNRSGATRNTGTPSAQDLDKVRDILFGEQVQDFDVEIAGLREELSQLRRELADETARREAAERKLEQSLAATRQALATAQSDSVDRVGLATLFERLAGELKQEERPRRKPSASD